MRSSRKGFELDPITLGTIALGIVLVVVFIVIGNNRMPQPVSPSYASTSTGAGGTGGAPSFGGAPYGAGTGGGMPYGAPTSPYGGYGAPPGMPPGIPPGVGAPTSGASRPPGPMMSGPSAAPSGGGEPSGRLGGLAGRRGGMGLEED
jgi:hypothetical protein